MSISLFSSGAQSNALTCLTCDETADHVIIGDTAGDIKIWSGLADKLVMTYSLSSDITCIVYENERIFSAVANKVEIHSTVVKSGTSILSQFAANVNYLHLNAVKTKLVACSDDHVVKLINLDSSTELANGDKKEISFEGHEGPVMSVAVNNDGDLIASSSCDGSVIVWNAKQKSILKTLKVLKKYKDISQVDNLCRVKWHPSEEKVLLVPLESEIQIIDCDQFKKSSMPSYRWSSVTSSPLTELAFSVDGQLLAAGTVDGWVIAWETSSAKLLGSWHSSRGARITGLSWRGYSSETVLICDQRGVWEAIQLDLMPPVTGSARQDSLTADEIESMFAIDDFADVEAQEDDKDGDDEHGGIPGVDMHEEIDSGDGDSDVDGIQSQASTEKMSDDDGDDVDHDGDEDYNDISISDLKKQFLSPIKPDGSAPVVSTTKIVHVRREPHPVMRSTSCPRNGNVQLMLWNQVAVLKQHFNDDGGEDTGFLEVDFQDNEVHRNLVYRHALGRYDMADVNRHALALVASSDRELASMLVRPLNASWREWHVTLPSHEQPVACALLGDEYAILLTDRGFLRYFYVAIGGMQAHIDSLPGTPVAMASSMYPIRRPWERTERHRLVVVLDDGERLVWRLEEVAPAPLLVRGTAAGSRVSLWHPLPLSNDATLSWIGFSDSGSLYTVDSKQCVRRLHLDLLADRESFGVPRWSPVLDLRKAATHGNGARMFPIGFLDKQASTAGAMAVRCLPDGGRYPGVVPLPLITVVPFMVPICGSPAGDEATEHEQALLLNQVIPDWTENQESMLLAEKQLLLKLFASAVTQDDNSRALAIAKLMPDSQLLQLAMRFAARNNRRGLAERLGELALLRDREQEQAQHESVVASGDDENDDWDDNSVRNDRLCDKENKGRKNESVQEVAAMLSADPVSDKTTVAPAAIESAAMASQSPFPVVKRPAEAPRKGMSVLDEVVAANAVITEKRAHRPAMSAAVFGSFSPAGSSGVASGSPKTFKLKSTNKRKACANTAESPFTKALKK